MGYRELLERESGSTVARSILGMSLLFGDDDIPQNPVEAFRWLSLAANVGAPRPTVWLGTMYEEGNGIPVDLSRARELYRFGAERGEFHGCVFLARLLASGKGGAVDTEGALFWYRTASSMSGIEECEELTEAKNYVAVREKG